MTARVRFKAEDIWQAPDDEYRYEVIDGELFMTPSPAWWHQRRLGKLYVMIAVWVWDHDLGEVVQAPLGVVLDPETAVQPDLIYISKERAGIISDRGLEGAPDLVVEVLSPSTEVRDRGIKMRRYAAAGIPHYWLLSPGEPRLEPHRLEEDGYHSLGSFGPGSVFHPELFPGLEIRIDEL